MIKFTEFTLTIFTTFFLIFIYGLAANPVHADLSNKYIHSTTPTLFFHDYGNGAHAEEYMINGFVKASVSKTTITADVTGDGTVILKGDISHDAINPFMMINFNDNHSINYELQGQWVKNVLEELQAKYHFKKVSIEAHSMGNMAATYFLLANVGNHSFPQIQKQVAMAETFDGAVNWDEPANLIVNKRTGKPSAMDDPYQKLLPSRHRYPRQIRLLNAYGDLKNGNDSRVSDASCLSLKYLINNHARSYRGAKVTGLNAKHELLHHNSQVNKISISFL